MCGFIISKCPQQHTTTPVRPKFACQDWDYTYTSLNFETDTDTFHLQYQILILRLSLIGLMVWDWDFILEVLVSKSGTLTQTRLVSNFKTWDQDFQLLEEKLILNEN